MQKKKNIILGVLIVILTILVCILLFVVGKKYNNSEEYSNVIDLDYSELNTKLENKDSFVLVLAQTTCSHCKSYLPVLNQVGIEYNLTFYKIEFDTLNDEEKAAVKRSFPFSGTPITVFVVDGEEKSTTSRLDGEKTKDKIIARLKKEGYINE